MYIPSFPTYLSVYILTKVNLYQVVFGQKSVRTLFKSQKSLLAISDQYHNFYFVIFLAKWLPAAILYVQNSLSMAFLAISDRYATYIFFTFLTKWLPSAILDVRNSLSIAFMAILDKYGFFF